MAIALQTDTVIRNAAMQWADREGSFSGNKTFIFWHSNEIAAKLYLWWQSCPWLWQSLIARGKQPRKQGLSTDAEAKSFNQQRTSKKKQSFPYIESTLPVQYSTPETQREWVPLTHFPLLAYMSALEKVLSITSKGPCY